MANSTEYNFPINDVNEARRFIESLDYLDYIRKYNLPAFFSSELLDDEQFLLFLVEKRISYVMKYASPRLKKDKSFVLKMIKNNGYDAEYIDETLQDDREIMALACKRSSDAFTFASKRLQNDKNFIKEVAKDNFLILEHVDKELLDDKVFVMELVGMYGNNLDYASERLKDDYEVVLWAIKHGPEEQVLWKASERIRANPKMKEYVSSGDPSLALEIEIDELKAEMKRREELFQSTLGEILNKLNTINGNPRGN